jgi:hypothetical protein
VFSQMLFFQMTSSLAADIARSLLAGTLLVCVFAGWSGAAAQGGGDGFPFTRARRKVEASVQVPSPAPCAEYAGGHEGRSLE